MRTRIRRACFLSMVLFPAACSKKLELPAPSIATIDPIAVCVEQRTSTVTVSGLGFTPLPTDVLRDSPKILLPAVTLRRTMDLARGSVEGPDIDIPDDPTRPEESAVAWRDPTTLLFRVSPALGLEPGLHTLQIAHPDGGRAELPDALLAVSRPRVHSITPDIVCGDQENLLTLAGEGFVRKAGTSSLRVRLGDLALAPESASDCAPLPGRGGFESCKTATVRLARGALRPGRHAVRMTNPAPVGCESEDAIGLFVEPPPTLANLEPDLICGEQEARMVLLTGTGFLEITDPGQPPRVPRVLFTDSSSMQSVTVSDAVPSGCTEVSGPRERLRRCTELTATIPPDALIDGTHRVVIENPAPADCESSDLRNLVVVPPPSIAGLSRPAVCRDAVSRDLTISGAGFLIIGTSTSPLVVPTVRLAQGATILSFSSPVATDPDSVRPGGCAPIAGVRDAVETCSNLTISLPAGAALGDYLISVTNPSGPFSCSSTESAMLAVTLPPSIDATGVQPISLCQSGGTLTITGSGFLEDAAVTLGGRESSTSMTSTTGTTVVATWDRFTGLALDTQYPVTVRNVDGCEATAASQVRLTPGIFTYFVDPPVVYDGVNTRITLLTSGISARPISVLLRHQGSSVALAYADSDVLWDPSRPQRVQVIVPRNSAQTPVPPGTYDAMVTDGTGCGNTLVDAFQVTDRIVLGLTSITPPFGYAQENSAVVLGARSSTGTPALELFQRTPRAYLNPTSDPIAPATEMRSVAFVDDAIAPVTESNTVTAVAPNSSASLPVGVYDVLVVNPDGAVGVLPAGYRVTALPVPVIDTIVPGSVTGAAGQAVQIQGANFRIAPACVNAVGMEDACVRLRCGRIGTATPSLLPPTVVTSATGTAVAITIDASALGAGDACAVRLVNEDGTFTDFSAITVANPSAGNNPIAFVQAPPMRTGRRAPATVGGRVTATARMVYAIGGDRGNDDTAISTVEAASVGLFGDLGSWFTIPVGLPEARTRAEAVRIGRFLYLVGGYVPGSGAVASVLRAIILDPADAPVMGDPDLRIVPEQTGGMPAGVWYYRVSAVRPGSDLSNPGGETLAGDPLVVRVPSTPGNRVTLRVSWLPEAGVTSYRLYRTPSPDLASGDERLLCVLDASRLDYEDDDDPTNDAQPCAGDPQVSPLPLGSTGTWHALFPDASLAPVARSLQSARASAGVAVAADRTDSALFHIYAVGGHDGATIRDTYEYLTVRTISASSQMVEAPWVTGAQALTGRTELGVVVADPTTTSGTGTNVCVFALAGRTGPGSSTGAVQVAMLPSSGGELGAWDSTFTGPGQPNVSGSPAGFSAALANNGVYAIGGARNGGTTPDSGGSSRTLSVPALGCDAFSTSWQSLGAVNLRARYLMGTAVQSGFIYLIGGITDAAGSICGDGSADTIGASCIVDGSVLGGQP